MFTYITSSAVLKGIFSASANITKKKVDDKLNEFISDPSKYQNGSTDYDNLFGSAISEMTN